MRTTRTFLGYAVGIKFAVSMDAAWTRFATGKKGPHLVLLKDTEQDERSLFDGEQLVQVLDLASDLIASDGQGLVVMPLFVDVPHMQANRVSAPKTITVIPPRKTKLHGTHRPLPPDPRPPRDRRLPDDPRETAVYPMTPERNQALQDRVEASDASRAKTYIAGTKLTLVLLNELRKDVAEDMGFYPWAECFDETKGVLEALLALLEKVDKSENAQEAANAPTEPPKDAG